MEVPLGTFERSPALQCRATPCRNGARPVGTLETASQNALKRPYGTRRPLFDFPALKCRATFNRSSGTTTPELSQRALAGAPDLNLPYPFCGGGVVPSTLTTTITPITRRSSIVTRNCSRRSNGHASAPRSEVAFASRPGTTR